MSTITLQQTNSPAGLPPILVLSSHSLKTVDADVESLFSLWTVFSKCKNSIENGRRLENMSWRLWNRERLLNEDDSNTIVTPSITPKLDQISTIHPIISTTHKHISSEQLQHLFQLVNSPQNNPQWNNQSKLLDTNNQTIDNEKSALSDGEITPKPTISTKEISNQVTNPTKSLVSKPIISSITTPTSTQTPSSRSISSLFSKNTGRSLNSKSTSSSSNHALSPSNDTRPTTELPLPVTKPTASGSFFGKSNRKIPSFKSNPLLHSKIAQQRKIASAAIAASATSAATAATAANTDTANPPPFSSLSPQSDYSQAISDGSEDTLSEDDYNENINDTDSDSDDERLSHHHRSATSTSIVRGFSPSNISISVVNRSVSQKKISPVNTVHRKSTDSSTAVPPTWKPTKARPDKLPREKMFFIESSPSDSEFGGESLSSSEGAGTPSAPTLPKAYNLSEAITGSAQAPAHPPSKLSHTSTASSTSSNSSNNSHHHHHHPHREDRKRSSLFSHAKSQPALTRLTQITKPALPIISKLQQIHKPDTTKNMVIMTEEEKKIHDEKAIETDDDEDDEEEDDIHEDDDDDDNDSAWDSVDDESDSSFDEESFFVREDEVPKKPLIRPSLLSSLFLNKQELLQEQLNAKRESISSIASTTLPNVSISGLSSQLNSKTAPTTTTPSFSSSKNGAVPINPTDTILNATIATHIPPPGALSPRTTRRNMLSTELSESLRRNLLWERQQNGAPSLGMNGTNSSAMVPSAESSGSTSPTISSHNVLRRSHTSTGVMTMNSSAALSGNRDRNNPANIETWKEDMDEHNLDFNYHARGW